MLVGEGLESYAAGRTEAAIMKFVEHLPRRACRVTSYPVEPTRARTKFPHARVACAKGLGTDGPISKTWNVRSWPTIYVLDAKGVIRFKGVHDKKLDEAVDQLLKELDGDQKRVEKSPR